MAKTAARRLDPLALARFGLNIDRRAISVVQSGSERLNGAAGDRPAIKGVHEIPEGARNTVAVTLAWHGEDYAGTATGPAAPAARMRLVGEAAVRAVESLLHGDVFALDSIGAPVIGMRTVICAVSTSAGTAPPPPAFTSTWRGPIATAVGATVTRASGRTTASTRIAAVATLAMTPRTRAGVTSWRGCAER